MVVAGATMDEAVTTSVPMELISILFNSKSLTLILDWFYNTNLDCGKTFSTKRKMAFSEGSWILLRMIHINWATEMSLGTRNFRLSIS
ncbi:hypothetical protein MAR_027565 [Mya arenaria]|uniref:Uncharacterized protein n=1 Tax=Mya arenaria TaxID=6604 RepID=A0ABY7ETT5_MYAAR|nr:hypothetical protein MAR_027565 [Mya arenaria]